MLVLSNDYLDVLVAPHRGGRIHQIFDKIHNKEWLWHPRSQNHKLDKDAPLNLDLGVSFDDHWEGGWDDIFPSDAPASINGQIYFDHGELWSQPWETLESSHNEATLRYICRSIPVQVDKHICVDLDLPNFTVHYAFHNLSDRRIPYLFKLHPALAIEEGDRFFMPACQIEPVTLDFSRLIGRKDLSMFPFAYDSKGMKIGLDEVLPRGEAREFVYGTLLQDGYCGLHDPISGARIKFYVQKSQFPFVWLFQSYGGFKGHYVAMIEPCTNKPYDLNEALEKGSCAVLAPFATDKYKVRVVLDAGYGINRLRT